MSDKNTVYMGKFFFCSNLQYDEEYLQTIHGVETWKLGNTRKFTNQEKVRKIHKSEKKKKNQIIQNIYITNPSTLRFMRISLIF